MKEEENNMSEILTQFIENDNITKIELLKLILFRFENKTLTKKILDNGFDREITDDNGNTLLGQAAVYWDLEIIEFLLKNGFDINSFINLQAETLFSKACKDKETLIIIELSKRGCFINKSCIWFKSLRETMGEERYWDFHADVVMQNYKTLKDKNQLKVIK